MKFRCFRRKKTHHTKTNIILVHYSMRSKSKYNQNAAFQIPVYYKIKKKLKNTLSKARESVTAQYSTWKCSRAVRDDYVSISTVQLHTRITIRHWCCVFNIE